ncbi:MAG: formate dehydrogenase accessory sulfurtransferase FdhD [Saprospirales bacterium]|nr:MAG: formate dehydrogenase accessory sulfurtransferase FdhD [Saprospirales bacterium]
MKPDNPAVTAADTHRFSRGKKPEERRDFLTGERPLATVIRFVKNGIQQEHPLAINMCTPGEDEKLAIGFLLTEGIISKAWQIKSFEHVNESANSLLGDETLYVNLKPGVYFNPDQFKRNFYASSSCGVCGKATTEKLEGPISFIPAKGKPRVKADTIVKLGEKMRPYQRIFSKTGGIHGTAVFDVDGNLIELMEDVGRHNAMDKIVGSFARRDDLPARDRIVSVSGRASFELVQKALVAGFPIMTAVGAPSDLAVRMASAYGMTLIGFLKEKNFNVYCQPERILNFEEAE